MAGCNCNRNTGGPPCAPACSRACPVEFKETPWVGMEGCGIEICNSDHPFGERGNGHYPTIGVRLSPDSANLLCCDKNGISFRWDCEILNACDINDIGNVNANPAPGDSLIWDVASGTWIAGSAFECDSLGGCSITDLGDVICNNPQVGDVFMYGAGAWVCTNLLNSNSTCLELTSSGLDIVIDPASSNIVECRPAGLYAPSTNLEVKDSDCINLALTGTGADDNPWLLEANPYISEDPNNSLLCTPDGLYVGRPNEYNLLATGGPCLDLAVTGNGVDSAWNLTGAIRIDPLAGNAITCTAGGLYVPAAEAPGLNVFSSSGCMDVMFTGAGTESNPYQININPLISPDPTNALECAIDGLYVEEVIVDIALDVADSDCINFNLSGLGTTASPWLITANPTLSLNPDNILRCFPDGLFASAPEQDVYVLNATGSTCIDLTVVGDGVLAPWELTADAIIDPAVDNALVCGVSGLYVAETVVDVALAVTPTNCIDLILNGGGTSASPWNIAAAPIIDPAADNALVCNATGLYVQQFVETVYALTVEQDSCLNLTLTGAGTVADPWTVSGSPVIDPAADNILACNATGLYVPPAVAFDGGNVTAGSAGTCVDLTVTGTGTLVDPYVVDAEAVISATAGNIVTCTADGLYVGATVVDAGNISLGAASTCIDLTLTGTGTVANPYVIAADAILDPAVDNALSCGPNGLYVPPTIVDAGNLTLGVASTCIDLTLTGTGTLADPYVIAADAIVDPVAGNVLVCGPDGLSVPTPTAEISADPCNALEARADGLFAPEFCSVQADLLDLGFYIESPSPADSAGIVNGACLDLFGETWTLSITNPSECYNMVVQRTAGAIYDISPLTGTLCYDCAQNVYYTLYAVISDSTGEVIDQVLNSPGRQQPASTIAGGDFGTKTLTIGPGETYSYSIEFKWCNSESGAAPEEVFFIIDQMRLSLFGVNSVC